MRFTGETIKRRAQGPMIDARARRKCNFLHLNDTPGLVSAAKTCPKSA
ncbi:hypothetical protein RSAG8_12346, partial [Rhizoctonia solani AG-8 WAC10335]